MFKEGDVVKYVGSTNERFRPENPESLGDVVGIDKMFPPFYLVKWRNCLARDRHGEDNAWYNDTDLMFISKGKTITTESYV